MSSFPPEVRNLVEHFARDRDTLRGPAYNEAQAHQEFIDPFFKTLGWDIDNEQGLAGAQTAHEKTVIQRQVDTSDRQTDQLVYEPNCLTGAEIRVAEEHAQ